jgi:hypothetical protein
MKDDLADVRDAIRRCLPESDLQPVPEDKLTELRRQYPDLPDHYTEFLRQVGWGSLWSMSFMLYSGPVRPDEILGPVSPARLSQVLFIGDDFAGWMLGLDGANGWRLVGWESLSPEPTPEETETLGEFVAELLSVEDCNP